MDFKVATLQQVGGVNMMTIGTPHVQDLFKCNSHACQPQTLLSNSLPILTRSELPGVLAVTFCCHGGYSPAIAMPALQRAAPEGCLRESPRSKSPSPQRRMQGHRRLWKCVGSAAGLWAGAHRTGVALQSLVRHVHVWCHPQQSSKQEVVTYMLSCDTLQPQASSF